MTAQMNQPPTPQARGREMAGAGKKLWTTLGSVTRAANELMARYPDVPSLQAYRYAAGLSQDQAAERYNEVTGHQTTLGGTSINAWESWARGRGRGSPPSLSSVLILCTAYGRGPLGIAEEHISPTELIAEAYERLPIEDQLSLKQYTLDTRTEDTRGLTRPTYRTPTQRGPAPMERPSQIGEEFTLAVPTIEYGNPDISVFSLPNPRPGELLDLTWETFGHGVERLSTQIKNVGRSLDVDACFGVNEAGLVMATFLASSRFSRCKIGYLRCNKMRDGIDLDDASFFPDTRETPTLVICDFEVKHADVIGYLTQQLRLRYPKAELYFAVFGAMTKSRDLEVGSFDDLTGAKIMRAAELEAIFIAATMNPPGIEPPLELR
ncbi:helix-turn-helix domain-containing protein [Nocardia nova]|uniref:helix-turn-helix domain-containing protein n=1 Tax=Nocardia nova TaxID=37330 RepID=UPI0033CE6256